MVPPDLGAGTTYRATEATGHPHDRCADKWRYLHDGNRYPNVEFGIEMDTL